MSQGSRGSPVHLLTLLLSSLNQGMYLKIAICAATHKTATIRGHKSREMKKVVTMAGTSTTVIPWSIMPWNRPVGAGNGVVTSAMREFPSGRHELPSLYLQLVRFLR